MKHERRTKRGRGAGTAAGRAGQAARKSGKPRAAPRAPAARAAKGRVAAQAPKAAKRAGVPATSAPAPAPAVTTRLPRDPKGGRAQFYQDPAIDQLWAVVTALTAEVSVAFDRLDTVERLLERDGRVTRAAIEAWRPDDAALAERAQRREELIVRVFQVLGQYGA